MSVSLHKHTRKSHTIKNKHTVTQFSSNSNNKFKSNVNFSSNPPLIPPKMSSFKTSSRYNSFNTRSSTQSDPSSSSEFTKPLPKPPAARRNPPELSSALVKTKPLKNEQNLTTMVKKFMEKRSSSKQSKGPSFVVAADFVAEDLKKTARKGTNFGGLHKKLFKDGLGLKKGGESDGKALIEVKENTRTLAMVLRSERELLGQNKEQEDVIVELKLILDEKNREFEKLKDLCLKQREEIKALKNAILFPDVMDTKLEGLLEKQGSELKLAKQLIPSLQHQVTTLTEKLQCLAEDLEEVEADKYSVTGYNDGYISSPGTPTYEQEEAANSLEYSSGDPTVPGSPDDMFLKDLNPCLTPYYTQTKSREYEVIGYTSPYEEKAYSHNNMRTHHEIDFEKQSKSSTDCQYSNPTSSGRVVTRASRRSDENKFTCGKLRQY